MLSTLQNGQVYPLTNSDGAFAMSWPSMAPLECRCCRSSDLPSHSSSRNPCAISSSSRIHQSGRRRCSISNTRRTPVAAICATTLRSFRVDLFAFRGFHSDERVFRVGSNHKFIRVAHEPWYRDQRVGRRSKVLPSVPGSWGRHPNGRIEHFGTRWRHRAAGAFTECGHLTWRHPPQARNRRRSNDRLPRRKVPPRWREAGLADTVPRRAPLTKQLTLPRQRFPASR